MLNICGLAVEYIRVQNDGYDNYSIHLYINPTDQKCKSRWIPLGSSYLGCLSFGATTLGDPKKFESAKDAVLFIKEEYGRYGISLLVNEYFDKVDIEKFFK